MSERFRKCISYLKELYKCPGQIEGPAKAAELIIMPFRMLTRVRQRNHLSDVVQIHTRKGTILRAKRSRPRTCPDMSIGSIY